MSELERVKAAFAAMGGTCETYGDGRAVLEAKSGAWLVRVVHRPSGVSMPWDGFVFWRQSKAIMECFGKTADVVLACVSEAMTRRVAHEVAGKDLVESLRRESVAPEARAEAMTAWLASTEVGNG